MAVGGGDYELNIGIDWSDAVASTNTFLSQVQARIQELNARTTLPTTDPNALDPTQFGQEARVQIEIARQLIKELQHLKRITDQTATGLLTSVENQGKAAVAAFGPAAQAAYDQHGTGGFRSPAYREARTLSEPMKERLRADAGIAETAAAEAGKLVDALKLRLFTLRELAALDKQQLDQSQTSIRLQAEVNAEERRRAAAIRAGTAKLLQGDIKQLAKDESRAAVFEKQLASRTDLRTSKRLAADPKYAERLGEAAANNRIIELRKNLEYEKQLGARMAENVRLAAEETQLRQLRLAEERAAASRLTAAQANRLANLQAESEINERLQKGRVRERTSDFYAGDSVQAVAHREREAVSAVNDKIAGIKQSTEYERLYSVYLQQNAQEVAEENALRQANNARLRRVQQELLASETDPLARRIRTDSAGATAASARAKNLEKNEVFGQTTAQDIRQQGINAANQELLTLRRRLVVARASLNETVKDFELTQDRAKTNAALVVAERRYKETLDAEATQALKRQGYATPPPRGPVPRSTDPTLFQRGYGKLTGRDPLDVETGRRFIASRFASTAAYGASGALLYGGLQTVREMITEAENLERIFNQVEEQFQSLGRADQFDQFRTQILQIARDTGSAADEVANVGFQLQGAFGGNTVRTLTEVEDAFRAVRVTGLEITEVIDAFTALTENFDDAGVTIENVADTALGLQERFGVLAKETIAFASDLAPVAAQLGFTVEELEALGAVSQKYSGRSGSSLAEAFGRLLPQIQENGLEFVQIFSQIPELANRIPDINEAFRTGNIRDFFEILLEGYSSLDGASRNYITQLLGGRRETAALVPVLENASELLREFRGEFDDTGRLTSYYQDLQTTLNQKIKEFGEELKQLGVQIFESGLGEFLKTIVTTGGQAIDVLEGLVNILSSVGGALGDLPGGGALDEIIQGVLLLKGLSFAGGLLGFGKAPAGANFAARSTGLLPFLPGALGNVGSTFRSRYSAGAQASRVDLSGIPGNPPLRAQFASTASGVAGGIKSAFAGFSWGTLGLTVGLIATQGIVEGAQRKAQQVRQELLGEDQALNEVERAAALKRVGVTAKRFEQLADPSRRGAHTIDQLSAFLHSTAQNENTEFQQLLDSAPLGSLSSKVSGDEEAAKLLVEDLQKQSTEALEGLLGDQELFAAYARQKLELLGVSEDYPEGSQAFEDYQQTLHTDLESFVLQINDGSAYVFNIQEILAEFAPGGLVGKAMRALEAELRRTQNEQAEQQLTLIAADEARSLFQGGDLSLGGYRDRLTAAIETMKAQGYEDSPDANQRKELSDTFKEYHEAESAALIRQAEALIEYNGNSEPQYVVDQYVALLRGGKLSPADQEKATESAIAALNAVQDARVDAVDTAREAAALMAAGIAVPKELQVEQLEGYLNTANVAFQDFLYDAFSGNEEVINQVTEFTAKAIAGGVETISAATVMALKARAYVLTLMRQARIAAAGPFAAFDPNSATALRDDVAAIDAQLAENQRLLDAGVPDLGTAPDFSRTGKSLASEIAAKNKQAAEEERQKALAYSEAMRDLALAQSHEDPVVAADNARKAAEEAIRMATDATESAKAQAALIRAQRQQVDAFLSMADAQSDLLIAQAEAVGDTVGAAEEGLRKIDRQLARTDLNPEARKQLDIERQRQVTAVGDARLQEGLDQINFNLAMEKITKQQAIAQLRNLEKLATSDDEIRALQLQIKGLEDDLGQDYQFNLPSEIGLPTLYEVRRLTQGGYAAPSEATSVDNRQITINFSANNVAEAEEIANYLVDQFSRPSRFGPTRAPY